MNSREYILTRYVELSVEALNELRVAAVAGSTASEELLYYICDHLVRAAWDARLRREALETETER